MRIAFKLHALAVLALGTPVLGLAAQGGGIGYCELTLGMLENPCADTGCDVDYDLWWSGYSLVNCGGCKVDWSYETTKNGLPAGLGNGHDSLVCSSSASHPIRCPCTGTSWVTFTFICAPCPQP